MNTRCILLAVIGLIPGASIAAAVTPAADATVRDGLNAPKDGTPDLVLENVVLAMLDGPSFEDRGFIEFSLAGLSLPISHARLRLPVSGYEGPLPFRIDVFAYPGDGQIALDDWAAGTFLKSFVYLGNKVVRVNVSSAVRAAVAAGQQFIGFRFEFSVPTLIFPNGPFLAFNSLEYPREGPTPTLRVTGGSLTGIAPERVICRNITTGQTVPTEEPDGDFWDCVEAGLDVRSGDQIMQTTTGPAK